LRIDQKILAPNQVAIVFGPVIQQGLSSLAVSPKQSVASNEAPTIDEYFSTEYRLHADERHRFTIETIANRSGRVCHVASRKGRRRLP